MVVHSYVTGKTFLTGFSHVNLSGVAAPELGVILAHAYHG